MKILILLCVIAIAACAPTPPPAQPTRAPTSTIEPTATGIPSPTRAPAYVFPTRVATRLAPSALPNLPALASAIKFTFDEGVSPAQRIAVQNGVALGQLVWGEIGAINVVSYANLDTLVEEERRNYGYPAGSAFVTRSRQSWEESRVCETSEGVVFCYITPRYLGSNARVHTALIHEYFHRVQGALAKNARSRGPIWLIEGSAQYAEAVVAARYGLADFDVERKFMMLRSRGIARPLSTIETTTGAQDEDSFSVYSLGFLASELLAANAGETAVIKTYWEQLGAGLSAPIAFEKAFGVTLTDFYARFEEYRRAEFSADCDYWARGSFGLQFVRALPPGSIPNASPGLAAYATQDFTPYIFCVTGFALGDLSPSQKNAAFKLPIASAVRLSCGGNCLMVLLNKDVPTGTYTLGFELSDGRKAQAVFQR